jgi:hypothetical protein
LTQATFRVCCCSEKRHAPKEKVNTDEALIHLAFMVGQCFAGFVGTTNLVGVQIPIYQYVTLIT